MANQTLNEYSDTKRLAVYKILLAACTHLYSKGKLQQDKFLEVANVFADLSKNDPLFLAHFAAWASKQDGKDLKVLSVFFNALSSGDGLPFFKGSELKKPNLRSASYALMQNMDVPSILRVSELARVKFGVEGLLNEARHFPTGLKTALRKYLLYRESNHQMLRGIRNSGLTSKYCSLYRSAGMRPSDFVVGLFKWNQKDGRKWRDLQSIEDSMPNFDKLTSKDIVEVLGKIKLAPMVALSVIPKEKITSAVASALLQNCSGNQAIVLYNWFSENGFLDVKAIRDLFKGKVSTATTAVDRIDVLTRDSASEDKEMMAEVRSSVRKSKANTEKFGKIFMMIDGSGSMDAAIESAKNSASIFAECVSNPKDNFGWGIFSTVGNVLKTPDRFRREDFHAALFGVRASGGTDCFALYEAARKFGSNIDVYLTDEAHHCASMSTRIAAFHKNNPGIPKPMAVVVVHFKTADFGSDGNNNHVQSGYADNGIPVALMTPDALSESALVAQSVAMAIKGELAIVDEIMSTELPRLPIWWGSIADKAANVVNNATV